MVFLQIENFLFMKKTLFFALIINLIFLNLIKAQDDKKPDWRKLHYLSEEEMNTPLNRNLNFVSTEPPTGEVRFPAEFEPMQAVMIRYPLGIPYEVVAEMSEDCKVITIVSNYYQSQAEAEYAANNVNMDNCIFVNATTDSYWIRDFGPWYIFNDLEAAVVDFPYDRPRPNDNLIPEVMADYWGVELFGMNVYHTGGNMMQDGRGVGASTDLVIDENSNETTVRELMRDFLGIDPYHITIDPLGDYIKHIDCWGKFLAPDKILIARVPESDPRYDDYEEVANYFATTNCSWGYPYNVYRVDVPGNYTVAPYTNSLILNNKVLVPIGSNTTYNENALAVYREAMPGYEVIGFTNDDYMISWENTDALHCRTRGVADFDMLFIDHRDVVFGEQEWQDSIAIVSKFIAYSGQPLIEDSLLVYYSIDGNPYQTALMTQTGTNEYTGYIKGYQGLSEIDYYVFGKDESGHRYTQPSFGALEPHHFTMEEHTNELLTLSPNSLIFDNTNTLPLTITNETSNTVTINDIAETMGEYLTITCNNQPIETVLPITLEQNSSLELEVMAILPAKNYTATNIMITSTAGTQNVEVLLNQNYFSINENDIANCEIYPNPAHNILTVKGNNIRNIEIFNAVGQCVLRKEQSGDINIDALPEGLYFVKIISNNNNIIVKKIVKN